MLNKVLTMGLNDYKSDSKKNQYGELACECAERIEDAAIADSSKNIYAGKVRRVISKLDKEIPEPEEVIKLVSSNDNSASTKNVTIMAMKTYYKVSDEFKLAEELGNLAELEDFSSDESGMQMQVEEWVTKDEVMDILDTLCPEGTDKTKRVKTGNAEFICNQDHKAIVATLYYTGLRVSEAKMIEIEHIDFDKQRLTVFRSKKGGNKLKKDTIRITDRFIKILKNYIEVKDKNEGYLFDFSVRTIQNRVKEIEEAYESVWHDFENCEDLTPHKFRHARVTEIANASDLEAAGEFVDHESLDTTMGYKHTTVEDQEGILPEDVEDGNKEEENVDDLLESVGVDSVEELKEKLG